MTPIAQTLYRALEELDEWGYICWAIDEATEKLAREAGFKDGARIEESARLYHQATAYLQGIAWVGPDGTLPDPGWEHGHDWGASGWPPSVPIWWSNDDFETYAANRRTMLTMAAQSAEREGV